MCPKICLEMLVVMFSLAVFSRGLSLIDTEHMTRPGLRMSWCGTAWQIFLNVHEGTLQACSRLAGPHSWASIQAETAAFQFLCPLLTIQLPFEHFCPDQMSSGIMTLKDNSSQPTLAISDLDVSEAVVSSPFNKTPLVADYSVTSGEHMMTLFLKTHLSRFFPKPANQDWTCT